MSLAPLIQPLPEEMRKEYKRPDFSKLERGKFYKQAVAGTHVVLLEPSIAKAFPTSEAVNEALSGLLTLAQRTTGLLRNTTQAIDFQFYFQAVGSAAKRRGQVSIRFG